MKQITITPKTEADYNLVLELLDIMGLDYHSQSDFDSPREFSSEFLAQLKSLFETEFGSDGSQRVNRNKLFGGYMSSMQALFDEKED